MDAASPKLAEAAGGEIPGVNVILATAAEARALTGREPEDAARELAKRSEEAGRWGAGDHSREAHLP